VQPNTSKLQLLTFDRQAVNALLLHTLEAPDRAPSYSQREGAVPPGLWLVSGDGIYLMSNGRKNGQHGRRARPVAYALEANPDTVPFDAWWSLKSDLFRGDTCIFLPAEDVQEWLTSAFGPVTLAARREGEQLHYELVSDLYPVELDT